MEISTHLKQRLVLGSAGFAILLVAIYFSYTVPFRALFVFLNAAVICLALLEYYHLVQHKGFKPQMMLGMTCGMAYVISIYYAQKYEELTSLPHLVLLLTLVVFFLSFFNQQPNPLANLAVSAFGIIYLVIPLSYGIKINYFYHSLEDGDGRLWLIYAFLLAKMTDTGAYFIGKVLGKTKLALMISPKKTVEGAIGGFGAAILTSLCFYFGAALKMTLWQSIVLGAVISLAAQFGDLAESLLKRDAGVKDSSSHLPGLGGILDIVDSLVFALPLMYFVLKMNLVG